MKSDKSLICPIFCPELTLCPNSTSSKPSSPSICERISNLSFLALTSFRLRRILAKLLSNSAIWKVRDKESCLSR